jgi:hypothetical protein|tara:strand:+ start:460 stop:1170 length:711 start_codon:yes stop_codon:yes gene_type:complete
MNGYILYHGKSQLDGKQIVVIATGLNGSSNRKTGNMVQTYILCADQEPIQAVKCGADVTICGNCPHRGHDGFKGRSCYVSVINGPTSVYRAWKRGSYQHIRGNYIPFIGRMVRIGTYGDPAAVPAHVWDKLSTYADNITGYTHQWAKYDISRYCLASCETSDQAVEAQAKGYRTFRIRTADTDQEPGEITCPASQHKTQCQDCGLCNGTISTNRINIAITAHGNKYTLAQYHKKFK